jgi:hypothetical protein
MEKLKRTRITVNSTELTIIRRLHGTAQIDCLQCGARVEMATPGQAVTLTGIHWRAIYELVERSRVHFIETADGHLLVCLDSLYDAQENLAQQAGSPGKPLLPSA